MNPPASARPQTWWHWMNGNVTKEGITADLEAMQRVGIGGAQIFNVDCGIPAGPVKVLSPKWLELIHHAAREADRLGLELCLHNCAGWSSSGGPWNTPAHAMQRVTTSELRIRGPSHFSAVLPTPPGQFGFYRDLAVLAFPSREANQKQRLTPKLVGAVPERQGATDTNAPSPLRIDNIEAKAGFNGEFVMSSPAAATAAPGQALPRSEILDLTAHLEPDGRLDWRVPAGDWTILRFGYTPIGTRNHPAPAEATGLECDKFSREALDAHWAGFVQRVLDELGPLAGEGKALNNVLIDSYEVGGQNWTPGFRAEFTRRRGYDPLRFLPTLTGRVVEDPLVSERFLWDMRRTIADLFADNYYGHFQELCHAHGLKASIEPYTGPFDSLQCGEKADIPMGEFWVGGAPDSSVKLAASVGHIFGRRVIGAESFTAAPGPKHGRWLDDPYSLKALGDLVFCQGVNRFIFHRYAMQPWTNRWPGMTMGQWGTHFDRTSTWFEQGRAWLKYVARCQYLLQQGRCVADVAYFCGQSAPVELRVGDPALPAGYDFDAVNDGVLLNHARMEGGWLVLLSGARYRVLVLPPSDRACTPALLRKLSDLVSRGLTVVGAPPQASPSLQNYPACDAQVKELARRMWGDCDGRTVTEHGFGKGKVVWGQSLTQVLAKLELQPDFEFSKSRDSDLAYIHRQAGGAEIYFVSNQRHRYDTVECQFRVDGLAPELWNPDTGRIEPAPIWRTENGRTTVRLSFEPAGSVFVVFRSPARGDHLVAVSGVNETPPPPEPAPQPRELRILKALYGAFQDSDKTMDVTEKAKALVASGTREIPANNDWAEDDPAPGKVKQLRVEWRVGGRLQTRQVSENQTVALPAGAEVVKAVYGALRPESPKQQADVLDLTEKLSGLVKDNRLSVQINNTLAGRDPAWLTPKELHLDYSLAGQVKHAVIGENETLTLPETDLGIGPAPAFGFDSLGDGKLQLMAWRPQTLELQWASGRTSRSECDSLPAPLPLAGPWEVHFPPGWGTPAQITFDRLHSWPEDDNPGVKYFSGTAAYSKEFEVPAELMAPNLELWLDLGTVKNLAEISLNGESLGILWKPPFRVNVTRAVKPGANRLKVKLTNLWPNRLIGDEQLPPDCEWKGKELKRWPQWLLEGKPSSTGRLTFTTWHHWKKDDSLLESGLLGPVVLKPARRLDL